MPWAMTPLPKYIEREVEPEDEDRYQNIFAAEEGAVVAPAAGLHFSRELMKRLEIKDCQFAFLTLHSGLGNFREIDVEDLTKHKMDSEQMVVSRCSGLVTRERRGAQGLCWWNFRDACDRDGRKYGWSSERVRGLDE